MILFVIFVAVNTKVNAADNIMNAYKTDISTVNIPDLAKGQVFVDKSVSRKTVTIDNQTLESNDYIVQLSAIAKDCLDSQKPVDVVFVLDITLSTGNAYYGQYASIDYNNSTIDDMIMALNNCIDDIMKVNVNNRVEIMAYGGRNNRWQSADGYEVGIGHTKELLPLDHYENLNWDNDATYVVSKQGTGDTSKGTYRGGELITGKYISFIESAYSSEYSAEKDSYSSLDNVDDITVRNHLNTNGPAYSFRVETNKNLNNIKNNFTQHKVYSGFSGTYTQMGIAQGSTILLNQSDDAHNQYLILLTDGYPNLVSTANSYKYDTINLTTKDVNIFTYNNGLSNKQGETEIGGESVDAPLLTTATAVYFKHQLDLKYEKVQFYNIGMSINSEYATTILNPEKVTDTLTDTNAKLYAEKVKQLFSNGSTTLQVGTKISNTTGTTDYKYAKYSYAKTIDDLAKIFTEVLDNMVSNACENIQIIDTIGDYMEVKDVLGVIQDGELHTVQSVNKDSQKTTYTFSDLSELVLEIRDNEVYCNIPQKYTTTPTRVIFTVGLKNIDFSNQATVKELVDNGCYDSTDKKFKFYTNKWSESGNNNTIATFTITDKNKYYDTIPEDEKKTSNETQTNSNVRKVSKNGKDITVVLGNNGKQEVEVSQDITINKVWNDENNKYNFRPQEVNVTLFQGEKEYGKYTLSASQNWSKTLEDLPKYDDNGNEYVYTLKEDDIILTQWDKYVSSSNGYTITNDLVRTPSTVVIEYVDVNGNKLKDDEVLNGYVGDDYTTSRKTIENYQKYGNDPDNASGKYTKDTTKVTYVYDNIKGKIIVKHIDKVTQKVLEQEEIVGNVPEKVTTSSKQIAGYVLFEKPEKEEYTLAEQTQEVNYYYIKQSNVVVKYIDENTGAEIPGVNEITTTYKQGESYTTEKKDISGYTYTKDTGNTTGTVADKDIEVVYYYKKNSAGVVTKHIDTVTKKEIAKSTTQTGLENEEYTTSPVTIDGYVLEITPSNATGKFSTSEIVVTYEYRKQSNVIVKYVDENAGAEIADKVSTTYKQGESYTTEKKDISGYTYTKDTGNTTGTVVDEDIEVVYYYKKNSAGVVTKHIDTVTKKEIAKSTTQTGLENEEYTTSPVTIDGYVLEITPSNATGKFSTSEIVVTYEYRKQSNVIVKYVDENTGAEIADKVSTTYKQGQNYTAEKKTFDGYIFTKDTGNTTGTVADKDIEVVYYYKKNSAGVVTKHIDTVTKKEIAKSTKQTGLENDSYTTSPVTIDGYVLEVTPTNATGKMTTEQITVTYEYRKLSNVIVKYIDENTGAEIADKVSTTYKQGQDYTTDKKDISGYTYTKDTGNVSGTVADKDIEVVYYYKKNSAGVVTKHIDTVTKKEIAKSTTQTGLENEEYTTSPVTIDGYVLEITPSNATGKFSTSEIVVTYEYRKQSNVIVKYVDENAGAEIADKVSTTYKQGESYTTEKKDISGYTYTKDTGNVSGIVADKDIEVVYYYKKTSAGVITKYIDQVTKEEIATSKSQTGLENDDYTTTAEVVNGYELVVTPDNAKGKMTPEQITVIYEYRKLSNVTVKYIDENTGVEIPGVDEIATTYKEGERYTTEKKEISGYTYTKDTNNTSGVVGRTNIEVVYYYKKTSAGVITKYIDQVTKEEIAASKSQTGLENDDYTTTAEVVNGYELVVTPDNAKGKMTPEQITVTYEYRKQSNVTVKYVDENTGKELLGQVTTTYKQGDPYTTEKKAIDGYTYTKDTGNVSGTVERENIEVVYYYKRNTKVVVKYIDEVTKEEIIDSVEITGLEKDPYETEEKEKAGYELVGVDGNTTGKMTVDPIEVTYKYRKNANLITKHIDKNSGEKIVEDVVKKYKEGDKYEALPQNIAGYVLVESPEETTGTMGRENVEKTFYYKKISEGLVVKYVDKITGELLDIEEYTGNENDLITFDEKTFLHYVIYSRPDVSEARLTPEAQEYTYYYVREAKVNVRGIDQDTKEVLYETTMSGLEGNEYTTEPRKVDGYELVKIPQNKDGVYSRNTQDVVYEYKKISGGVTVKYLDKETGEEVADEERITGYVGDTYQTEKKEVEDYNFVEVKGDAIGSLEAEEKEVIYYYEKKTGKVEVIYEDREGNVLLKEEMTGKVKEKYKVEEKEIKNYKIVERPEQTEGEYKEGTIILKYILEKKQGRITVNFVDKEGNKLAESITTEGYVEESYELEAPEIEGYKVIKNGQIKTEYTEEEQIIDVVYEKVEIPETGDEQVYVLLSMVVIFTLGIIGVKKYNNI